MLVFHASLLMRSGSYCNEGRGDQSRCSGHGVASTWGTPRGGTTVGWKDRGGESRGDQVDVRHDRFQTIVICGAIIALMRPVKP